MTDFVAVVLVSLRVPGSSVLGAFLVSSSVVLVAISLFWWAVRRLSRRLSDG